MPILVPVKDVMHPQHLAAFVFTDRAMTDRAKMEVYTGWVRFEFYRGNEGIGHETVMSFVPLDSRIIQPYWKENLPVTTVIAAPAAFADDDEGNGVAVDDAMVKLEQQDNLPDDPNVLVLRATIAALAGSVLAFTYQVTVLTRNPQNRDDLDPIKLQPGDRPGRPQ